MNKSLVYASIHAIKNNRTIDKRLRNINWMASEIKQINPSDYTSKTNVVKNTDGFFNALSLEFMVEPETEDCIIKRLLEKVTSLAILKDLKANPQNLSFVYEIGDVVINKIDESLSIYVLPTKIRR